MKIEAKDILRIKLSCIKKVKNGNYPGIVVKCALKLQSFPTLVCHRCRLDLIIDFVPKSW